MTYRFGMGENGSDQVLDARVGGWLIKTRKEN